jgi:peptidylprolyl isomerase
MRTSLVLAAATIAAAAVALAGCGSSSGAGSPTTPATTVETTSQAPAASSPEPAVPTPSQAPASAVPVVSGKLGFEPTIAASTGAAPASLLVHDVAVGTGATAEPGDDLQVQYTGAFYTTGKVFDASWTDGNGPFEFTLDASPEQVITGWDEGIVGMKVGGRRELVIPPSLAYGAAGQGSIPPNSTLVFVVDLASALPAS